VRTAPCALLVRRGAVKNPARGNSLIGGRDQPHLEEFKQGLRERGYSEGKEYRLGISIREGKIRSTAGPR